MTVHFKINFIKKFNLERVRQICFFSPPFFFFFFIPGPQPSLGVSFGAPFGSGIGTGLQSSGLGSSNLGGTL